ncbi:hypothetical protein [Bifidobacterium adolescentis]|uniref:hypothetical protein n=1 Tax=Bifidobacterium adolescentis TaxID=1680 RepID=UPI003D7B1D78
MQQINVQYSPLAENRFVSIFDSTEDVFGVLIVKFELIVRIVAIDMMENKVQRVPGYSFICIYRGIEHIVLADPSV